MRQLFQNKYRNFPENSSVQDPEFCLPSWSESKQHTQRTQSPFSFSKATLEGPPV